MYCAAVSKTLTGHCWTVEHLLRGLVCPEAQCPSSAFHYGIRMQAAENASLVIFGWIEVRDDNIIGIREGDMAGRAAWSLTFALTG
jgi:hypothetical protein